MMKETKQEFEICWDCHGEGGYNNYHNGGWDTCFTCNGKKQFPMGTKKWLDERKQVLDKIREGLLRKVENEADKKIKIWERRNPKPKGLVTVIYE